MKNILMILTFICSFSAMANSCPENSSPVNVNIKDPSTNVLIPFKCELQGRREFIGFTEDNKKLSATVFVQEDGSFTINTLNIFSGEKLELFKKFSPQGTLEHKETYVDGNMTSKFVQAAGRYEEFEPGAKQPFRVCRHDLANDQLIDQIELGKEKAKVSGRLMRQIQDGSEYFNHEVVLSASEKNNHVIHIQLPSPVAMNIFGLTLCLDHKVIPQKVHGEITFQELTAIVEKSNAVNLKDIEKAVRTDDADKIQEFIDKLRN